MRNSQWKINFSVLASVSLYAVSSIGQVVASDELVESLPEHLLYLYSSQRDSVNDRVLDQLVANNRRWEPGRILRVCMFGGNEVVGTLIRDAATEWNLYSSVRLEFGSSGFYDCLSPNAGFFQIRIGFASRGFWSAVGTDSERRLDPSAPSMNFDGFNFFYSSPRLDKSNVSQRAEPYHVAAIKHEFGHALGLLHEMQNPSLGCKDEIRWSGPGNIYEYYAKPPNRWSPDQVQRNLGFIEQADPDFMSGDSDPLSIMMYSLPAAVLKGGAESRCFAPVRHAISEKDKQIIARIYPPVAQASTSADMDLSSATVRFMADAATQKEVADATVRIFADLDSGDTFTRRDARARLANLLAKLPPAEATTLIQESDKGSYRVHLGTAVAISNAPTNFRLTPDAREALINQARLASDPTLKKQLDIAKQR